MAVPRSGFLQFIANAPAVKRCFRAQVTSTYVRWLKVRCHQNGTPVGVARAGHEIKMMTIENRRRAVRPAAETVLTRVASVCRTDAHTHAQDDYV